MALLALAAVSSSSATATVSSEAESLGTLLRCDIAGESDARCLWADGEGNAVGADEIVRRMMRAEGLDAQQDAVEHRRLQDHMRYLEDVRSHAVREGIEFSYKVGVNTRHLYLDEDRKQTAVEFVRQELQAQRRRRLEEVQPAAQPPASSRRLATLPATFNWCSSDNPQGKSICTPVKSQNRCGSCWAFAATDAIETAVSANSKTPPIPLSPQQFLDCSKREMTVTFQYCWASSGVSGAKWLLPEMKWGSQNNGCDGGMTHGAFADAAGLRLSLMSELDLPYKEVDQVTLNPFKSQTKPPTMSSQNVTCENVASKAAASIENWEQAVGKKCDVSSNPTELLKLALQTQPISVAINSGSNFKDYKGGLYECPNNGDFVENSEIDHAVVLVGYGMEGSTPYWIIKNSYSSQWGDKGYLNLKMDSKLNCGVNVFPVVPLGAKAGSAKTTIDGGGDKLFLYLSPGVWIMIASVVSVGTIVLTVMGVIISRRLRAEQLESGRQ
ncbi:hypothetical protein PybrP1_005918 [[Pythium] brassicae (nom. inval.)]|nr:hypothetical protein PybrP1_005918 [[Pythium] brassicae (nom. inval.)]